MSYCPFSGSSYGVHNCTEEIVNFQIKKEIVLLKNIWKSLLKKKNLH